MRRAVALYFFLLASASADIELRNTTGGDVWIQGTAYGAGNHLVPYPGDPVAVETPTRVVVLECLDGMVISADAVGVTSAVPRAVYLEILFRGFWFGLSLELFGMFMRVVRAMKSPRGEVL